MVENEWNEMERLFAEESVRNEDSKIAMERERYEKLYSFKDRILEWFREAKGVNDIEEWNRSLNIIKQIKRDVGDDDLFTKALYEFLDNEEFGVFHSVMEKKGFINKAKDRAKDN
jgi:hypothetical protein